MKKRNRIVKSERKAKQLHKTRENEICIEEKWWNKID